MERKNFTLVGGDKRNIELARMLCANGHTVKLCGFSNYELELPIQCKNLSEAVKKADYIIGPIPASHNGESFNAPFHNQPIGVEELFKLLQPKQKFLAGVIKPEVAELAKRHNVHVIDMLKREELLVRNAIPTAEGAIKIAIEETDITLHGNAMMVIGNGRIGSILSTMLRGMGAFVSVVVNSGDAAARAESAGHQAIYFEDIEYSLPYADVIFNTVPEILLDKNNMNLIRKDTLIVDLASPPYGVEVNDSRDFGIKVLYTNSLPGKIAPRTAASYILDTIIQIIDEKDREENSKDSKKEGGVDELKK